LLIPLSQTVFRYLPEAELREQRNLTTLPNPDLLERIQTWHEYLKSLELFFNDNYGFRSLFIRTNQTLNIKCFNVSPNSDVIIGKEGWLFYDSTTDGVNLKDFYGKASFDDNELKILKNNLINLRDKFEKKNIDLIMILAPNKHTIYSEYLPTNIQRKKGSLTRADQIYKIAKEIKLTYIDARQPLIEAKEKYQYPLYYKTDTHWNGLGSYVAFKEVMKFFIDRGYLSGSINNEESFVINSTETSRLRDLAGFINYTVYEDDINVDTGAFSVSNKKILLIGDSFSDFLLTYLSKYFSKIVHVRDNTAKLDYNGVIEKEKPDIVIIEFVERYARIYW